MQLGVGAREKIGNHIGALPLRMALHEGKLRVFLVALGREANVIELNFVCSRSGNEPGQGKIVILHPEIGWVAPDKLAVLTPGLRRGLARRDFALRGLALRVIVLNSVLSDLVLRNLVLSNLVLLRNRTILRALVLCGLILRSFVFSGFG